VVKVPVAPWQLTQLLVYEVETAVTVPAGVGVGAGELLLLLQPPTTKGKRTAKVLTNNRRAGAGVRIMGLVSPVKSMVAGA